MLLKQRDINVNDENDWIQKIAPASSCAPHTEISGIPAEGRGADSKGTKNKTQIIPLKLSLNPFTTEARFYVLNAIAFST